MPLNQETVTYVARLARIALSPDELTRLSHQLTDILDFIDALKQVDTCSVPPTSHILPLHDILRDDVRGESLPRAQALANAPEGVGGEAGTFFVVPRVIE